MAYTDKHPDTLSDIALYAGYATETIRQTQAVLNKYASMLGDDGDFLRAAADMIGNAIHDELEPHGVMARNAMASGDPQRAVVVYHREMARA